MAAMSMSWMSTIQERRRPSSGVSSGTGTRSIKGAQRNFTE